MTVTVNMFNFKYKEASDHMNCKNKKFWIHIVGLAYCPRRQYAAASRTGRETTQEGNLPRGTV